ncbi:MAG: DMT family transporter [Ignisphaera sp.]|nr:DMT family transporter [Ignisphaera sp.]MCX8168551.1 DMT family transporter [Ignisphaera sp.]MDW8085137.1 DMT family transporter [Ignisphaera sp.]
MGCRVGYTLFFVAMISIGSASILVRLSGASAVACAFWRLLLSIPPLLLLSIANRAKLVYHPSYLRCCSKYFILSGVALALHFILWMDSLFRIPIGISTTIVVAYPIHLLVLEAFTLREIPRGREAAGILIAFAGIGMFFSNAYTNSSLTVVGVLESFIASILAAVYFYTGRLARKSLDVYSYAIPTYALGALTVAIYNHIFIRDDLLHQLSSSWAWLVLLALVPMIGGHTVMNYLLRYFKSSIVTSIALAEPIIATLLAIPLLAEVPSHNQIAALTITLSGVAIAIGGTQNTEF